MTCSRPALARPSLATTFFGHDHDLGNFGHPPWLGRFSRGPADPRTLDPRTPLPPDRPPRDPRPPDPTSTGQPKISRLFFPLPSQFSLFLPSLGGLLVEFGGVFEGRDPQMCAFPPSVCRVKAPGGLEISGPTLRAFHPRSGFGAPTLGSPHPSVPPTLRGPLNCRMQRLRWTTRVSSTARLGLN